MFTQIPSPTLSRSEEMFYQLALRQFGNYGRIKLEPPPPVRHLITLAVEAEGDKVKESGMTPENVTKVSGQSLSSLFPPSFRRVEKIFSLGNNGINRRPSRLTG